MESSGVVESPARPGVFWTHNDSRWAPELHAVDGDGRDLGTVRVTGAGSVDWEDLAVGPCGDASCLYIADTGDNFERRERVVLLRVREPEPGAERTEPAEAFPMVFPDGPRDIEAMFLLPGEALYFVTKGRNHPVTVFRYPGRLTPGEDVVLEPVQRLTRRRALLPRHVTGGAATQDGGVIAIRTYETLRFYRFEEGALVGVPGGRVSLRPLREAQGEAVALLAGNRVLLTSEAGPLGDRGGMIFLRCSIPGLEW